MKLAWLVCLMTSLMGMDEEPVRAGAGEATGGTEVKRRTSGIHTIRSPVKAYEEQYSGQSRWGASSYYLSDKDCAKLMEEFRSIKEKRGK